MIISGYLYLLEHNGTLQEQTVAAITDYHRHDDYAPITTWDEAAGYKEHNQRNQITVENSDCIEGVKQYRWIRRFFYKPRARLLHKGNC